MQAEQEFLKYLDQYEYALSQIKIYMSHFENRIDEIFQSIASKSHIDEAHTDFHELETIQNVLCRALYSMDIKLNDKLHNFVKNYDCLNDDTEKTRLFNHIHASLRAQRSNP